MTQEEKRSILAQLVRPYKHYINQRSLSSIITHTEYTILSLSLLEKKREGIKHYNGPPNPDYRRSPSQCHIDTIQNNTKA